MGTEPGGMALRRLLVAHTQRKLLPGKTQPLHQLRGKVITGVGYEVLGILLLAGGLGRRPMVGTRSMRAEMAGCDGTNQ